MILNHNGKTSGDHEHDDEAHDQRAASPARETPRKKVVVRQRFVDPLPPQRPRRPASGPAVLITGGAGFLGANLAHRLLSQRRRVIVVDNLTRPGAERNIQWLRSQHDGRLRFETADVRDVRFMRELVGQAQEVYHLASFGGELSALTDPLTDFDVNVRGTLSVLEAVRAAAHTPRLVAASTARVYGPLSDVPLHDHDDRCEPAGRLTITAIDEQRPLEFHTPFSCSRGAADQYVIDYARTFNLAAAVLRFSTVIGPHQAGSMDQHWVAHLLGRAIEGQTLSITGDGRQVRDILHADDAVEALLAAMAHMDSCRGAAFNVGGGPERARSVLQVIDTLAGLCNGRLKTHAHPPRPGDPRWYVSDTARFERAAQWSPRLSADEAIQQLHAWMLQQRAARLASGNGHDPQLVTAQAPGDTSTPLAGE